MDKHIQLILQEMDNMSIAGAPMQLDFGASNDGSALEGILSGKRDQEQEGYTSEEYRTAKAFLDAIGDADRAREILDKCIECVEDLDLVDDVSAIDIISQHVPEY